MRVLHAAYASDPAAGVMRQMGVEQTAADRLGIDWQARFFVPRGTPQDEAGVAIEGRASVSNRIAFKREYYRWLADAARDRDVVLLRYLRYDPWQLWFLMSLSTPVLLVHHTLEGPQIRQEGGPLATLKWYLDEGLVKRCHARAKGVVAVTEEIADYERMRSGVELPALLYPNGIAFDSESVDVPLPSSEVPSFLFVASRFVDWHGLDKLIDAAARSSLSFTVHIVGALEDEQRQLLSADSRFEAHGLLPHAEVERLAARCSLGLGSFSLDRKDMHQACTLKVREYLVAGLPVYAGHADVFDERFRFYCHGECEMAPMLEFARSCAGVQRQAIVEAARPWIDKEVLVKKLYDELCGLIAIDGSGGA